MAERTIAALHLSGTGDLSRVARATVTDAAMELGLDHAGAADLATATGEVVTAVAEQAFDDPADVELDVSVLRIEGSVAVWIDDLGLPFAFVDEDDAFHRVLTSGWVDEAHHESRGEAGNRTELRRHLDHAEVDVRVDADPTEHADAHAAPSVPADAVVKIRTMVAEDAPRLARLTWRTYGYSYQHAEFYRPDLLAELLGDGTLHSWVGEAHDGEIVGHAALMLDQPDALVVERGRAMVDPRYRGHHLMSSLYEELLAWATERGMYGRYSDAVTAHTRSQQLWGDEHQPAMGLLLGYLPPTVTFRRIHDDDEAADGPARRQAILIGYHQLREHPELTVYAPAVDREWIERIYDANELPRSVAHAPSTALTGTTQLEARIWRDVGTAMLVVHEPGDDLHQSVRGRLRAATGAGVEVVYADLPLTHPGTPAAADVLAGLGFSFGGIVPLLRDGGDVLRYQRAVDLDVDPGEIHLYGLMAQDLLRYVLERRDAVS